MIRGYNTLGTIRNGASSVLMRARRLRDGRLVVLKQARALGSEASQRLLHEYKILRGLELAAVVRALGLERAAGLPVLVLEDLPGQSLRELLAGASLPMETRLKIAIAAVDAVGQLHAAGLVHNNIQPAHIMYDRDEENLRLVDFSLAQPLDAAPDGAPRAGSPRYMSPEQSGRMHRAVDYRSDYYSLGVTLYELFCDAHPFATDDPVELTHSHIAQRPAPPRELQPELPEPLAGVIMKLLEKNPEERYQSAVGIQRDFEACLRHLRSGGVVIDFHLGRHDVPQRIALPDALFGRERELKVLLDAFDRVDDGHKECMLISGAPGIGKSALVRGLQAAVAERNGWCVMGKCDQHERHRPYSALVGALRELVKHLLTEPEARLEQWREAIASAVGANGRLVTELVPELELIIGEQPAVTAVSAEAARNIYRVALTSFLRVFCRDDHPLLMYLDDLQWIDHATLVLIETLLRDPELGNLFMIGAYREQAVPPSHPLLATVSVLRQAGVPVGTLRLEALAQEHITALVARSLHAAPEVVQPLAALIYRKTEGNPFFAGQLLRDLHDQGLIGFDHAGSGWNWDLAQIHSAAITDNVIELMQARLQRLQPGTQRLLAEAACIGSQFELSTLQQLNHHLDPRLLADSLREALDAGLLLALGEPEAWLENPVSEPSELELRFAHDRIRDAAYALLGEDDKPARHLEIGRALLAATPLARRPERVFELVNQLNPGALLITSQSELDLLAELNLLAGQRAKLASAFDPALHYLHTALGLLGPVGWQRRYDLMLSISIAAAEAAYLCGDFVRMEQLAQEVLANARNALEKARIYEVKIQACLFTNELPRALQTGLEALDLLGVCFPRRPTRAHILYALMRTRLAFAGKHHEDLLELPLMTDPHAQAVLRILARMGSVAYIVKPDLHPLLIFKVLGFARKHGNAAEYTFAYATYSLLLSAIVGDIDRGHEFGRLALDLLDRTGARHLEARTVVLVSLFTTHWKHPLRASLAPLKQAWRSGLASGDFEYASYGIAGYVANAFYAGQPLPELEREARHYLRTIGEMNQGTGRGVLLLFHQLILNLLGRAPDPLRLSGPSYEESSMLRQHLEVHDETMLAYHHIHKMMLAYLNGALELAQEHGEAARRYPSAIRSMMSLTVYYFYDSLVQLARYPGLGPLQRARVRRRVRANQRKLRLWARHAPMNFRHKALLVEAEYRRVRGDTAAAQRAYEQAIEAAAEHEYIQEEALASELAAAFHEARGQRRIAAVYREMATTAYRQWGCGMKLAKLEQSGAGSGAAAAPLSPQALDLGTLKKALKSIAAERIHSRMIAHIIRAAVEFTGAQSGQLLLRKPDGKFAIEAEWNIDQEQPIILQSQAPEASERISLAVLNYVRRTREGVVIHDAVQKHQQIPQLQHDPYITRRQVKSILCLPIVTGTGEEAELTGILYLENNRATRAFTEDGFETLEIIGLAAAGRLELSRKAATDGLTGLYNYDYFRTILSKEFQQARRKGRPLSLAMIDIDYFKNFNDTWGHQAGDQVLREVTVAIRSCCRDSDTLARYGGEEMALILPETDTELAQEVAERVRARVEAHAVAYGGEQLGVTVSIGIACIDEQMSGEEMLIRRADEALYRSKRNGRNRVSAA